MMKERFLGLLLIATIGSLTIATLTFFSIKKERGNFKRKFTGIISRTSASEPRFSNFYIAGARRDSMFLASHSRPGELFVLPLDDMNSEGKTIALNGVPANEPVGITVATTGIYLVALRDFALYGTSENHSGLKRINDEKFFIADAVPISNSSFAIKTFASNVREYVLALATRHRPYVRRVPGLLEKQVDGLFCTDGMLHFNSEINRVIYLYYYRNEFIVMDSTLNLVYRGNTIDSTSHAAIKVAEIKSDRVITLDSPPRVVNDRSSTSGNHLFVNSTIPDQVEDLSTFKSNSVIDVYDLATGQYELSFYLPYYSGIKMTQFKVYRDRLFAVYGQLLVSFKLNLDRGKSIEELPGIVEDDLTSLGVPHHELPLRSWISCF